MARSTLLMFVTLACILTATLTAEELAGANSGIKFDARETFSCREVTPKEFPVAHKGQKVIEVTIGISANFIISEKDVESVMYRISMPKGSEIADFLPKTFVDTDHAGTVDSEQRVGQRGNVIVNLDASGKIGYRLPVSSGEVSMSAVKRDEQSSDVSSTVQMRSLPPKQLVVASGTEERGHTLYFKLQPFTQITLEGQKEFAFLLIVPKEWSSDTIGLDCTAYQKGYKGTVCEQHMTVGLYMSDDDQARKQVEKQVSEAAARKLAAPKVFTVTVPVVADKKPVEPLTIEGIAGDYEFKYKTLGLDSTACCRLNADGSWIGHAGSKDGPWIKGKWSWRDQHLTVKRTEGVCYGMWMKIEQTFVDDVKVEGRELESGDLLLEGGAKVKKEK